MKNQIQTKQGTGENVAKPIKEITPEQAGALSQEKREVRHRLGQMAQTRPMLVAAAREASGERFGGLEGAAAREADIEARIVRHDEAVEKLEARELEITRAEGGAVPAMLRAEAAHLHGLAPELAATLEGQDAKTIEKSARALAEKLAKVPASSAPEPGAGAFGGSFRTPGEVAW